MYRIVYSEYPTLSEILPLSNPLSPSLSLSLSLSLETRVDLAMLVALLARHLAAPFEDAIAVGQLLDHAMLVPPAAAEKVAAIRPRRCGIAFTILCSQRTGLWIRVAKVWRIIGIYQLVFVRRLRVRRFGHKTVAIVA